jgi:hypothetical protein
MSTKWNFEPSGPVWLCAPPKRIARIDSSTPFECVHLFFVLSDLFRSHLGRFGDEGRPLLHGIPTVSTGREAMKEPSSENERVDSSSLFETVCSAPLGMKLKP